MSRTDVFVSTDWAQESIGAPGLVFVEVDADSIAYCRIGEESSHTWFVLRELLGQQNVKNCDGSWTEYGSLIGVPIEKGA